MAGSLSDANHDTLEDGMMKSVTLACAATIALAPAVAMAATTNTAGTSKHKALTEAQARNDIQLDGYTNITDLHQGKTGWMANAQEDGKPVKLMVNDMGVKKI
jgi:hypothetical protein